MAKNVVAKNMTRIQKTNTNRSWTKCPTKFCCGWVFDWRLMKGDTNCAECGCKYPPYEKHAKKQTSNNDMSLMKELFKEILLQLPMEAQEKLKTSCPGLVQVPETSKPSFLAQQQRLAQMAVKIDKAKIRHQTEFDKLDALKQEYQRVLLETTAPATDTTEPCVLPQPEMVADEVAKTVLSNFLAQEQALLQTKKNPGGQLRDQSQPSAQAAPSQEDTSR